jgi:hypothetical protein
MEDFELYTTTDGLPAQRFQGMEYRLYPKEKYFSRGSKRMHVVVW